MISEETLRQMPAEDRAALARALAIVNAELPSLSAAEHRRRRLVLMLTVASAVLIPWIVLLALTLPRHYVAGHWRLTWVGFDIILLAALASHGLVRLAPPAGRGDHRVHHGHPAHL